VLILEDEPFSREDFEGVLRVVWWMDEQFEDAGGDSGRVETSHDTSSVGRVAEMRGNDGVNFRIFNQQLGATRIITIAIDILLIFRTK
jgi:hypothetical protein